MKCNWHDCELPATCMVIWKSSDLFRQEATTYCDEHGMWREIYQESGNVYPLVGSDYSFKIVNHGDGTGSLTRISGYTNNNVVDQEPKHFSFEPPYKKP